MTDIAENGAILYLTSRHFIYVTSDIFFNFIFHIILFVVVPFPIKSYFHVLMLSLFRHLLVWRALACLPHTVCVHKAIVSSVRSFLNCVSEETSRHHSIRLVLLQGADLKALSVKGLNVWLLRLTSLQWTHWCSCSPMANKWLICVHTGNIWWRFPLHISPAHCIKLSFNKSWWMTHTTLLLALVLELEEIV